MRTLLIATLCVVLTVPDEAQAQGMTRGMAAGALQPGSRGGNSAGQPGAGAQRGGLDRGFQPGLSAGQHGRPDLRSGQRGMTFQPRRAERPGARPDLASGWPAAGLGPARSTRGPGHRDAHWRERDGRWIGGWNAPGGWNGYRPPRVGRVLPPYWMQPAFGVGDWAGYGLAPPPYGYSWSRYYDDAVLIDARGAVYDIVGGVDWNGDAAGDRGVERTFGYSAADRGGRSVSPDGTTIVTTRGGDRPGGSKAITISPDGTVVTTTTSRIAADERGDARPIVRERGVRR